MLKPMLGFSLVLVILPFAAWGKPRGSQAQTSRSPTTQTSTVIVTTVRSLELNPPAAIAVTTERAFVVRIRGGMVEWVDVKRGASMNRQGVDLVEIFGDLGIGDQIAVHGADELRVGVKVNVKQALPAK